MMFQQPGMVFLTQPSNFSPGCPVSPGFRLSPAHLPGARPGGNLALEVLKRPSKNGVLNNVSPFCWV